MSIENIEIMKISDVPYSNKLQEIEREGLYCEIKYKRDRSSFAGVAFKLIKDKNIFIVNKIDEEVVYNVSKYENLYVGVDSDYIDSLKEVYESYEKNYGIEIKFLLYSDVRSSQIIFEELMQKINENIESIMNYFN